MSLFPALPNEVPSFWAIILIELFLEIGTEKKAIVSKFEILRPLSVSPWAPLCKVTGWLQVFREGTPAEEREVILKEAKTVVVILPALSTLKAKLHPA